MLPVLIGSQAIQANLSYHDWLSGRDTKDFDFICTMDDFKSMVKYCLYTQKHKLLELKYVENKAVAKFEDEKGKFFALDCSLVDVYGQIQESDLAVYTYVNSLNNMNSGWRPKCNVRFDTKHLVAPLGVNLMLKMSHRYKKNSPHFLKTMRDIKNLRNHLSEEEYDEYVLDPVLPSLLKQREEATYNYKHPSLKQGKSAFFTDSVNYVYDHDTIHDAVAMLDTPAYTYYVADGAEVHCDKHKFNDLPEIVKLYGVLEESYVLALERAIIPFDTDPKKAFDIALEKVCTSITSGWFREFAWENYEKVQALYHESFVRKFKSALDAGKIKPFMKGY